MTNGMPILFPVLVYERDDGSIHICSSQDEVNSVAECHDGKDILENQL